MRQRTSTFTAFACGLTTFLSAFTAFACGSFAFAVPNMMTVVGRDHSKEIELTELFEELEKMPGQHVEHKLDEDMADDLMREAVVRMPAICVEFLFLCMLLIFSMLTASCGCCQDHDGAIKITEWVKLMLDE